MEAPNWKRHVRSFILPLLACGIIPSGAYLLEIRYLPDLMAILFRWMTEIFSESIFAWLHPMRWTAAVLLILIGFMLWLFTVRLFHNVGRGTLAPWDPTQRLVTIGPYAYCRNPMITGVLFFILGEALAVGSVLIFGWCLFFFMINTFYFVYSEEPGLRKRFGEEYIEYCARVSRWWPRCRRAARLQSTSQS